MTNSSTKLIGNKFPEHNNEAKRSLQERFVDPIIKVSVSQGVMVNRLQSFWNNQNCHTQEKTAS
ncbi:hypothetical protein DCCM_4434 [Desulfocucumis palustris]|uniref:Uncharacterized protein n=1 Tax=Desulfocucumis palustris TaxID=1898651 RepID=A0A2L2XMY7_9FIRM|nr:hypothetical protein [Desulfocucumis palustris]GBF35311.1 hypothetical protein DCCM_4434 [Desulfocucumis palustris]